MAGKRRRNRSYSWVGDSFLSYLHDLTLRSYLSDFFLAVNHRAIIGFIVGVMFFGFGFGRMFVHPGWQSLGVVFVGLAVAFLCFVWPLLRSLATESFKGVADRFK